MIVRYEGRLWDLDMGLLFFRRMKREYPQAMVTLIEATASNYKEKKRARLGDLE